MDREEILRSARNLYENPGTNEALKVVLEETYPELKESKDERIRTRLIALVEAFGQGKYKNELLAYLERQKEQQPAEWSEEDENMLWNIISIVGQSKSIKADEMLDWLKSLRPQQKKELSIEKAIQWLDDTFCFLDNSSGRGRDYEITTHDFNSLEEMYDSFRKAVTVDSQPHWKPSEEQMEALDNARFCKAYDRTELDSLYEQLNKLFCL